MRKDSSSVTRGIFFFLLCSLITSCGKSSLEPSPEPSSEIQATSTQFPDIWEFHEGTGSSELNYPSEILPARFNLASVDGTHSVVAAFRLGIFETTDIIYTQSLSEAKFGISSVEVAGDRVLIQIETEGDWMLGVDRLSEDNFLAIPGKVSGNDDFFFVLTSAQPKYLFLDWVEENSFISIQVANGEDTETLIATTKPYSGWMPILTDGKAIMIDAYGHWFVEIVDRPNLVD